MLPIVVGVRGVSSAVVVNASAYRLLEEARAASARREVAIADSLFARSAASAPSEELFGEWCEMHAAEGDHAAAERVIRDGISRFPTSRSLLLRYAALQRTFDQRDDSAAILSHVLLSAPGDADALALAATVDFERGRDAIATFERATAVNPGSPQLVLGFAAALHAQGRVDDAIALLTDRVRLAPNWIEGLSALARLRWERGDGPAYVAEYERLIGQRPQDIGLWGAFLGLLASSLDFPTVLARLPAARSAAGNAPLFDMLQAQALSETGQNEEAEHVFRSLEPIRDPGFVPVRLRSLLRTGRAREAADLGERFVTSLSAPFVWPLLGIAWRMTGDSRCEWLDHFDECTTAVDLDITPDDLADIAGFVRSLHRSRHAPYDQSVRGGSQTIGNLLERTDPPIVSLRSAIRVAVRTFIDHLPAKDRRHPFLGRNRGPFRFAGSWSVRLAGQGHHVAHVHPMGWISSALYLAIPPLDPPDDLGGAATAHAGWLGLGGAPPELGLGLEPVRWIEPKPGRLALFPSIMWHETAPFSAGERLTVAFDIIPFV